ncbi:hypothetical protein AAIH70_18915 [Neorhizobium sp. BT27B]|uniref:hypothetical protein n=1 Tax=Neorhizobium sp. BT27B TaxID=3142625 RepID=UPI003D2E70CE
MTALDNSLEQRPVCQRPQIISTSRQPCPSVPGHPYKIDVRARLRVDLDFSMCGFAFGAGDRFHRTTPSEVKVGVDRRHDLESRNIGFRYLEIWMIMENEVVKEGRAGRVGFGCATT